MTIIYGDYTRKEQPALAQSMDYSETPVLGCALGGICERHLIPLGLLRACLLKFVSTVRARCQSVTGSRRIVWRFRFERHLGAMAKWALVNFRAGFEFPLDHTLSCKPTFLPFARTEHFLFSSSPNGTSVRCPSGHS